MKQYTDYPVKVPGRLESAAVGGIVADAKNIYDIEHQKKQSEINAEIEEVPGEIERINGALNDRYTKEESYSKTEIDNKESGLQNQINTVKGGSSKSINTLDTEINGNGGIDERLETVEQLGTISVGGGDIGIATASDFEDPTPEQRAKVPTVGAVLGITDDTPIAESGNLVKSGGVYASTRKVESILLSDIRTIKTYSLVIGSFSLISVGASSYYVVSYTATKDCKIRIKFKRNDSYENDGNLSFINGAVAGGTSTTLIKQLPIGDNDIDIELLNGQTIGLGCHTNDVAPDFEIYNYEKIDEIAEDVYELSLKEINPVVTESIVIGSSNLISVPSEAYKIASFKATKDCGLRIKFKRLDSYANDGNIAYINGAVEDGTSITQILQVAVNEEKTLNVRLKNNETIGVGYTANDVKPIFFIEDYEIVREIQEGQNQQNNRLDELEEIVGISKPTDYTGGDMSAFKKILCIGDSLTSGAFNYTEISGETWVQPVGYSYPENLKRISGSDVVIAAVGGITSSGWYDEFSTPEGQEVLSGCDCCIINLGTNDDVETLNTVSRTAFINIISLVKSLNKQIKIFLSGMINGKSFPVRDGNQYEIKDNFLRALYNELYLNDSQVFFLDMKNYDHLQDLATLPGTTNIDNWNMGHLSAYGYWRLAKDYFNYISHIMAYDTENIFRDIQFTGTDFNWEGY